MKQKSNKKIAGVLLIFIYAITIMMSFNFGFVTSLRITNDMLNDHIESHQKYRMDILGFYITNNQTPINNLNYHGEFVCVNVERSDYSDALETCNHEVAHHIFNKECRGMDETKCISEIFAESCEEDISKCLDLEK